MHCHEARHLLRSGVQPGTAAPVRTMLGFHVARCESCRGYRAHLANQHVLARLLDHMPPSSPVRPLVPVLVPAPVTRRAAYSLRAASAAVIIGGLLALSPVGDSAPARAADAPARAASVNTLERLARVRAARLAPAVATRERLGDNVFALTRERVQAATLPVGSELAVPALPASPAGVVAAPVGQYTPFAVYTVQRGDSLGAIALRYYGNASLYTVIYNANQWLGDPTRIYAGQRITIPSVLISPTTPGPQTGQTGQTGQGPGSYTVRAGDSLSSIAQAVYGNPNAWYQIYNANTGTIGGNANLIYPGQVFSIPPTS